MIKRWLYPSLIEEGYIIRYDSEAAYDKFWNGGGKAWIEKYAPQARSVRVEGVEPK